MANFGDDDDDTTTPIDLDARRPEVPLGRAWLGLQRTLRSSVDRVGEIRAEWGEAPPDRQAALALALAGELRDFADIGHDLAHQLEDFARRKAPGA